MKTIPEHMKDILIERGYVSVSYGDLDDLHECAKRSGMYDRVKSKHGEYPLNIINKVMNALDRSDLFKKGYLNGYKNRKIRCFYLK